MTEIRWKRRMRNKSRHRERELRIKRETILLMITY